MLVLDAVNCGDARVHFAFKLFVLIVTERAGKLERIVEKGFADLCEAAVLAIPDMVAAG